MTLQQGIIRTQLEKEAGDKQKVSKFQKKHFQQCGENKTETNMQTIIVLHHFKGTASAIWCPLMIRKHIAISFFNFILFDTNLCCILMFSLVCPERHQT